MKKTLLSVFFVALAAVSASAQEMFIKPMAGGTLSTITSSDNSKMKFGFVGGAEFGYRFSPAFCTTAGALVSMQGARTKDDNFVRNGSVTLTYLNIPILANYYIAPGLAVKAGVQPGFRLSYKLKGEEFYDGEWHDFGENNGDNYLSDEGLKTFDFSIPLGISYEFSDFVIDARYNLGLTKISDDVKCKNSVIMLTVGYKIPL